MKQPMKLSGLVAAGRIQAAAGVQVSNEFDLPASRGDEQATTTDHTQQSDVRKIALSMIDDSPYQPRTQYDPTEIDNLAHTMAAAGQQEPIRVRAKNGRYELIAGHRRIRAARNIGWMNITADIIEHDDRAAELATMVHNEGRIDLTDYERGKLYQRAKDNRFAETQMELGHLFGTSQARVSRCMAMLKLPGEYLDMLDENPSLFGCRCAESIIQLTIEYPGETALIKQAVDRIVTDGADQKSVKAWVQQMVKQKSAPTNTNIGAMITDRTGREIFRAKFSSREITIKIRDAGIDQAEIEQIITAALKSRAERSET